MLSPRIGVAWGGCSEYVSGTSATQTRIRELAPGHFRGFPGLSGLFGSPGWRVVTGVRVPRLSRRVGGVPAGGAWVEGVCSGFVGYPARMAGSSCRAVSTTRRSPSRGGGRRVGARSVRITRAGMLNSSRRIRATVRRSRPLPSSMPVSSWIQFEMAQASSAAHIHTVFTGRDPDGR